jgi:hypothetical protein
LSYYPFNLIPALLTTSVLHAQGWIVVSIVKLLLLFRLSGANFFVEWSQT